MSYSTRLEYNALVLTFNPGIVLTRTQIFEAVWNMESDTCQSSVANVIYNLRKKIEPDSRKPTYIKRCLRHRLQSLLPGNNKNNRRPPQRHTMTGNQEKVSCFFAPPKNVLIFQLCRKVFSKSFPRALPYLYFSA